MNLQAPDGAPWILHAGAALLLATHIGGGATGIVSGGVAMVARKGGRLHRQAGKVFFGGMLAMTVVGATVAPFLDEAQWTNTLAATFTFYLVVTGWLTARRRDGQTGALDRWAMLIPIGVIAAVASAVLLDAGKGDGTFGTVYAFAVLSAVGLAGDLNQLRRGGLSGPSRTARHIWRISLALFVATGSYFMGQPKFVPEILKTTGLNFAPPLAVLVLLVFWLVRVRLPRRRRPTQQPVAA